METMVGVPPRVLWANFLNEEVASNPADLNSQQTEANTGNAHGAPKKTPTYCTAERGPATCASENMLCRYFDKLGPVGWFGVIFGVKIGLMHLRGEINLFRWGVCHTIAGLHGSLNSQYPLRLSHAEIGDGLTIRAGRATLGTVTAVSEGASQHDQTTSDTNPQVPVESSKYCTGSSGLIRCGSEVCKFFNRIGVPVWTVVLFGILHAMGELNLFDLGICKVITRPLGKGPPRRPHMHKYT